MPRDLTDILHCLQCDCGPSNELYTDFRRVETFGDFLDGLTFSERERDESDDPELILAAQIAEGAVFSRYHGYQN